MKSKLILLLILLFGLKVNLQAQTVGIKIATPIIKNNPADNTITGYANLLNGGWHIVTTTAGRDSLSTNSAGGGFSTTLETGMICYVISNTTYYQWSGSAWNIVTFGNNIYNINGTINTSRIVNITAGTTTTFNLLGSSSPTTFQVQDPNSNGFYFNSVNGLADVIMDATDAGYNHFYGVSANGNSNGGITIQALNVNTNHNTEITFNDALPVTITDENTHIGLKADVSVDTAQITATPKAYVTNEWVTRRLGGGGGVSSVTGSGNIASSGGTTPNITFTGILPFSNGGSYTVAKYATTAALLSNTYNNGSSGIGATLTGNSNGAISVDGATPSVNDKILVWNEATQANDGVYDATQVGDASHPYILTRDPNSNTAANLAAGSKVYVQLGTLYIGVTFTQTTTSTITIGTTALVYTSNAANFLTGTFTGTGTIPDPYVLNTAGPGFETTATAFNVMVRDGNANSFINNLIENYQSIVTSGSTTTLLVSSAKNGSFTGTTTQTLVLPVVLTLITGYTFQRSNYSTGVVTVQSSGGNTVQAMAAGTSATFRFNGTSGTTAASWDVNYSANGSTPTLQTVATAGNSFSGQLIPNSIAINGTAGTGFIDLATQSTDPTTPPSGHNYIFADASGRFSVKGSNGFDWTVSKSLLTANRIQLVPDSAGTYALESRLIPDASISSSTTWNNKFTLPSLTNHSILFSNGTTITQDNSNFYFDGTNHRLYINNNGDITATNAVNVYGQYDAFQLNSAMGSVTNGTVTPGYTVSTSRGTPGSPSINNTGDLIGGFSGWAYTRPTPAYTYMAGMSVSAVGSTATDLGGQLDFYTKANNASTTTSWFTIANDGTVTFSKYGAGLLHANASGVVSSSLVTNSDLATASTAPTASYIPIRDANANISGNSFISNGTTTTSAGGTTTLTAASSQYQSLIGSTLGGQTYVLPVVSTLAQYQTFIIANNGTGINIVIQSSGLNAIATLTQGQICILTCILTSGTSATSWSFYIAGENTAGLTTPNTWTQTNTFSAAGTAVGITNGNLSVQNGSILGLGIYSTPHSAMSYAMNGSNYGGIGNLSSGDLWGGGYNAAGVSQTFVKVLWQWNTTNFFASAPVSYSNTLTAINSTATATAAQIGTRYITSTSAAATTITMPTATAMATQLNSAGQGYVFDFYIDNSAGANTVTLALGSGFTSLGSLSTTAGLVGQFRIIFTSATAGIIVRQGNPPIHGNSTTTGTATTVVTVTIGSTLANNSYNVTITPRDLLTAVNYYISAQTTTTFDVTFVTALTGSINFDYNITP